MSGPFYYQQARWYTPGGMREPRAVVWHMAEGGGTVGYFTRTDRRVSSHFVIEYSGRIVQMVKLADASWAQHVRFDTDDNDAEDYGIYSEATGRRVLGDGWVDVNRYVVAVEVEGYRKDGPNATQRLAIISLHRWLRANVRTLRGGLGHRDLQDYKSCPGGKFPWADIDGHGLWAPDTSTADGGSDLVPISAGGLTLTSSWLVQLPAGTQLWNAPGEPRVKVGSNVSLDYMGRPAGGTGLVAVMVFTAAGYSDGKPRPTLVYVREADATSIRARTATEMLAAAARYAALAPDGTPFSQADVDAAVKAALAAEHLANVEIADALSALVTKLRA